MIDKCLARARTLLLECGHPSPSLMLPAPSSLLPLPKYTHIDSYLLINFPYFLPKKSQIYMNVQWLINVLTHLRVCDTYMYLYIKRNIYIYIYIYIYMCVYICICVCVCAYIYMSCALQAYRAQTTHTHKHIHTHTVADTYILVWRHTESYLHKIKMHNTYMHTQSRTHLYISVSILLCCTHIWGVQHTAIHCNTLQRIVTHCDTVQHHTATHQHRASRVMLCDFVWYYTWPLHLKLLATETHTQTHTNTHTHTHTHTLARPRTPTHIPARISPVVLWGSLDNS